MELLIVLLIIIVIGFLVYFIRYFLFKEQFSDDNDSDEVEYFEKNVLQKVNQDDIKAKDEQDD